MAVIVITQAKVLLGAQDLSGYADTVTFGPMTVQTKSVPTFTCGGYDILVPGLKSTPFTVSGFQDLAAGGPDPTWQFVVLGQQNLCTFAYPGSTVGDVAYFTHGVVNSYMPGGAKVGDVNPFSATVQSDVQFLEGAVAVPTRTISTITTTNGSSTTLAGPTSGHTLYAGIHVTALTGTGTPTATYKVQSAPASNFAAPVDRITTFSGTSTGAMTTTGWLWGSVAGPVTDGFWRVVNTTTGSTISVTDFAVIGVL